MTIVIRIIRAVIGLVVGVEVIDLIGNFRDLVLSESATSESVTIFAVKILIIVVGIVAFIGLRALVNWLHRKRHGVPHPSMEKILSL